MSIKLVKTTEIKKLIKQTTTKDFITRASSDAIDSGVATKSVVFTTAMANNTYVVSATIENTADTNPDKSILPIVTAKATTGFTVDWNAPTNSANYKLNWIISEVNAP